MTAITATTLAKLFAYRPGPLATGTLYSLAALGLRAGAQVALLVLLARALGAGGFGAYTSAMALGTLLAPFAFLGVLTPLVRDVAQDSNVYAERLAVTLMAWMYAAPVVTLGAVVLAAFLPLPMSWTAVGVIVAAEVLIAPLVDLAGRVCQAHDRTGAMSAIMTGLILCRLAALLALFGYFGYEALTLTTYAWGHLAVSALYAGALFSWVLRRYGPPDWHGASLTRALQVGRPFLAIGVAQRTQAEANKPLLLTLAGASAAGIFAAAHRTIDVATLPITAFVTAVAPRIHRAAGTPRAVLLLLPIPLLGAAGLGTAVWFAAPLLPWLLGQTFNATVGPVQMLCAMPMFTLLRLLSINTLIASGKQGRLLLISIMAGGAAIVLTLALVPPFGLAGVVYSTYAADGLVVLAAWFALRHPGPPA